MAEQTPVFRIGLVMAGAVSAGAYTAGVVDFLMEALEAWEREKRAGNPDVPTHRVRLDVITGASAGSIAGAVLASSLRDENYPELRSAEQRSPTRLYQTWVEEIDITKLLAVDDLDRTAVQDPRPWWRRTLCCLFGCKAVPPQPGEVRSVLNSDALDRIAEKVLDVPWSRTVWPPYVADSLKLYLTVTNLRGVPYFIEFSGPTGNRFGMSQHADYMSFSLDAGGGNPPPTDLGLGRIGEYSGLSGNWATLGQSALASGAFPVGLAARVLERIGTLAYDERRWSVPVWPAKLEDGHCVCSTLETIPPSWPAEVNDQTFVYRFANVDGGVANNEPFEMARRYLADGQGRLPRGAKEADRSVLMVDPFPDQGGFDCNEEPDTGLIPVLKKLMGAMIAQLRFKTDELALAQRGSVHSRWIVAPSRSGPAERPPVASGSLGAFGGFLCRAYRDHDYQLGRRNCQRFLQAVLLLHEDNPVFAGHWTEAVRRRLGWATADAAGAIEGADRIVTDRGDTGRFLPVVPLYGACAAEVPEPVWPKNAFTDFKGLGRQIKTRLNRLTDRLIETSAHDCIDRALLKFGWRLIQTRRALRGKDSLAVKLIVGEIEKNLRQNDLLD